MIFGVAETLVFLKSLHNNTLMLCYSGSCEDSGNVRQSYRSPSDVAHGHHRAAVSYTTGDTPPSGSIHVWIHGSSAGGQINFDHVQLSATPAV